MHDKEKLYALIDEYWKNFVYNRNLKDKNSNPIVVCPSIPIIWFGDLKAYKNSSLKVVTIGINPSCIEFQTDDRSKKKRKISFHRFSSEAEALVDCNNLSDNGRDILIENFNNYFIKEPYEEWFESFRPIFNIISNYYNTSVNYKDAQNMAIHIDCRTALATNLSWTKLKKLQDKLSLSEVPNEILSGVGLFEKFLEYLKPDIILFSQREKYLKDLLGENGKELGSEVIKTNNNGVKIKRTGYNVGNKLLIYGTNDKRYPFKLNYKKDEKQEKEDRDKEEKIIRKILIKYNG